MLCVMFYKQNEPQTERENKRRKVILIYNIKAEADERVRLNLISRDRSHHSMLDLHHQDIQGEKYFNANNMSKLSRN